MTLAAKVWPFLASAAVRGGVVLLLAAVVLRVWSRGSAAQKHLVWTVACCSLLALPVLALLVPEWSWRVLPAPAALPAATASAPLSGTPHVISGGTGRAGALDSPGEGRIGPEGESSTTAGHSTSSVGWIVLILGGWAGGVLLVLAALLYNYRRVRRFVSATSPLTDARVLGVVRRAARTLRLSGPVRLREHPSGVPMVYGAFRPAVVLPECARVWDEERLWHVCLHELAHVKRRDNLAQGVASLVCALYWFNPLVWVAARELRLERERACDDCVLVGGVRPRDYATDLVELTQLFSPTREPVWGAIAFTRASQMLTRVQAIVDRKQRRAFVSRGVGAAVWGAALGVASPLSGVTLRPGEGAPVARSVTRPVTRPTGRTPGPDAERSTTERRSHEGGSRTAEPVPAGVHHFTPTALGDGALMPGVGTRRDSYTLAREAEAATAEAVAARAVAAQAATVSGAAQATAEAAARAAARAAALRAADRAMK